MMSGNVYTLDRYLDNKRDAFDLFIGSVSFEKRCIGAGVRIKEAAQNIKHIYLLDYVYSLPITAVRNVDVIKTIRKERIELQKKNKKVLAELFSKNAEFPYIKIEDPLPDIVVAIEKFFNGRRNQIDEAERICIDISTFTKPFFFLLIKMIVQNFNRKHFFVVNTIPAKYTPSSLSFNIWGAEIMPAYNGIWNSQNRNILITVLGFEGHKLSSILEKWTFSEVIPIIGFPAFYPGLQDRTLSANTEVIKRINAFQNLKYSPSLDPFETYKIMKDICDYYYGSYNVAIAPLGPKPMALASVLLSIEYDLRIVYAFPQEYNPSYSQEIGESFLYEVELK